MGKGKETILFFAKVLVTLFLGVVFFGMALNNNVRAETQVTLENSALSKKITELKQQLKQSPDDTNLLLQLAVCYLKKGKHRHAKKVFAHVVRVAPGYGNRIGREYAAAGNEQLKDGRIRQARILFQKAIFYVPDLKKDIAKSAFLQGKRLFDRGLYDLADERFAVANSLNDVYGSQICEMFFTLGHTVDAKRAITLYRLASWYCSDHNEEIGLRMLQTAKNQTSKKWMTVYKEEAAKYVSKETVQAVFPEPSWKTVHASVYVGKGFDDVDSPAYHIRTVQFGKDVLAGDKIIVESQGGFKIWDAGWDQYESTHEFLSKGKTAGEYFYVEGPKGKKIIVKVQRYQ